MTTTHTAAATSYADAGVDLAAADAAVDRYAPHLERTRAAGVLPLLGGFASGYALPIGRYREPVLATSTDGVGTKLLLARQLGEVRGCGIDAVAMVVNDIAVTGADPLVVLDYVATGALDPAQVADVVAGVADGCAQADCSLVGGETAELPGMFAPGELDVACFATGIGERADMFDAANVRVGDVLVGLGSNGLHSNGFSLVRAVLRTAGIDVTNHAALTEAERRPECAGLVRALRAELLQPSRIYVRTLTALRREFDVHAAAHVTGGGLPGNLPRVLPDGLRAHLAPSSWERPAIFDVVAALGGIDEAEMYRVFNMGLGIMLAVRPDHAPDVVARARQLGERAWVVGHVQPGVPGEAPTVVLDRGADRVRAATAHDGGAPPAAATPQAVPPADDAGADVPGSRP